MSFVIYGDSTQPNNPAVTYKHPDNEANLRLFRVVPLYSRRGFRWGVRNIMQIEGEILATSQADFQTKIGDLIAAYSVNGNDFAFFDNDGNITNHAILASAASSLTGTKVIERSWPKHDGSEWATKRTYRITIQGDFIDKEPSQDLLWYYETVRHIGTTGQRWKSWELDTGAPISQTVNQQTVQRIVQSGTAFGLTAQPSAPGSLLSSLEHLDLREVEPISPRRERLGFYNYGIRWRYVHTSDTAQSLSPNNGG